MITLGRHPTRSELLWFGVIFAAVFGVLGNVVWWQSGSLYAAQVLWGIGAGGAALYYVVRPLRVPFYHAWMALVLPIGWLVSRLLLGFVYYGIVTPLGLLMRLFGRDKLGMRFDPEASSYWVERLTQQDTARYFRQS